MTRAEQPDTEPPCDGSRSPRSGKARRLRIALVLLVLLTGWYAAVSLTDREGIREAVYRHQIQQFAPYADTFYLATEEDGNPSGDLLGRFSYADVSVAKASDVPPPRTPGGPVPGRDGRDAKPGCILGIDGIDVVLPCLAIVNGYSYQAPLSGAGYTFVVVRTGRGWRVLSEKVRWVS